MKATPGGRVLVDACVLYPPVLREVVLGVAAKGLFVPLWSPRILAEWALASGRLGPAAAERAGQDIARLRADWPQAEVTPPDDAAMALTLPDAGDRHVLAAAVAGHAQTILTANLRDFPHRALAPHGLRAVAPDAFLMTLWLEHPAVVEAAVAAVQAQAEALSNEPRPLRRLLRKVGLPRLGKALAAD